MDEKFKALIVDLGKPTLRGVRKCPKCGTFNGTRGLSCKNKTCDVKFKEPKEKSKATGVDAVKLNTGAEMHIFSVRIRDRGPDYRGFVQLPLIQGLEELQTSSELELIIQSASQCYVDSCQHSKENFLEITLCVNPCRHIRSSMVLPSTEATPLTLKNSVFNTLAVKAELKDELWQLANDTTSSALVQRRSKNAFVVKCQNDLKHSLGYLHFYCFEHKRQSSVNWRTFCECRCPEPKFFQSQKLSKCLHYYACICAFASDDNLKEEFGNFFASDFNNTPIEKTSEKSSDQENQIVAVTLQSSNSSMEYVIPNSLSNQQKASSLEEDGSSSKKSKISDVSKRKSINSKAKISPKKYSSNSGSKKATTVPIEENCVYFSFQSWLASVTERINQTMHFQFPGRPDPLVFHTPQMFFDCLQQRISSGSRKKRLPNTTTTFTRKDALPLGVFTKYSWHITNILHVKQIFDTPQIQLQVTRSFVENRDGTYEPYNPLKNDGEELAKKFKKTENSPLIKPLELKTFLKVGNMSPDSKDPVPFTIEWIPNILPQSGIGELRISFEYGHLRNGRVEISSSPCILHLQELCS